MSDVFAVMGKNIPPVADTQILENDSSKHLIY